ncbi:aldo/keto reductase [Streptomyces sp. NPDC005065]|uniref:aldo/keto reductase n=1 Tax=unclassified Streptomyces TaxID=2593676 RepID=UPI0033B0FE5D
MSTQSRVRFGRTGRQVSRLGMQTGQLTETHPAAHREAVALVREAVRLGVGVIDTAPLYGRGAVERIVGEALEDAAADVCLITKIGRFVRGGLASYGDACYQTPALIEAQFEQSLRLLRRDRVDLLLLHEADWVEWWPDGRPGTPSPVLDVMAGLRAAGRIGGRGCSPRRGRNRCGSCAPAGRSTSWSMRRISPWAGRTRSPPRWRRLGRRGWAWRCGCRARLARSCTWRPGEGG